MPRITRAWTLAVLATIILVLLPAAASAQAIIGTFGGSNQALVFPSPGVGLPNPARTPVPGAAGAHGVAYYGSDNALVSNFSSSQVFVIQISTATLLSTISSVPLQRDWDDRRRARAELRSHDRGERDAMPDLRSLHRRGRHQHRRPAGRGCHLSDAGDRLQLRRARLCLSPGRGSPSGSPLHQRRLHDPGHGKRRERCDCNHPGREQPPGDRPEHRKRADLHGPLFGRVAPGDPNDRGSRWSGRDHGQPGGRQRPGDLRHASDTLGDLGAQQRHVHRRHHRHPRRDWRPRGCRDQRRRPARHPGGQRQQRPGYRLR